MSATLPDDSALVSNFNIDVSRPIKIITPNSADDIGDRMILFPQVINPQINEDMIKEALKKISHKHNVVIIVPSYYRAQFWHDVSNLTLNTTTINDGIKKLKEGHVGLVVLINKYDGIDLPEDACRVLVIDGLPDVRSEFDKVEQIELLNSERLICESLQKVEQGMGRGVRSSTDSCVVVLIGKELSSLIFAEKAIEKFSAATKAQIELSEKISEQVKGKNINEIFEVMQYSFNKDKDWVNSSRSVLLDVIYNKLQTINPLILAYRKAFDYAEKRDYRNSVKCLLDLINSTSDNKLRGWLKLQMAEYINYYDQVEAQEILKSAQNDNLRVIKPIDGIQFDKTLKKYYGQGESLVYFLKKEGFNENKFTLKINEYVEKLVFRPETAHIFENAFEKIAFFLGLTARRPESEYGKGPDVLWRIGELKFIVIECKNGVQTETICKHDCNQLNGSAHWFENSYDSSCEYIPIMIHKANFFEHACSPNPQIRIMTENDLEKFKNSVLKFSLGVVQPGNFNDPAKVNELLAVNNLNGMKIVEIFTSEFRLKS